MKIANRLLTLALLGTAAIAAVPASAQSITGVLDIGGTNYFDPARGFVPAGFGNQAGTTVPIGAIVEFGFRDGANFDTADFTLNSLLLTDVSNIGSIAIQYRFTASVDGFFNNIALLSNTLGGTYSVAGNTLTYNAPQLTSGGTYTAQFSFDGAGAGVPEPAAWALMIGGFGMVGGAARRRKTHTSVAFG